MSALLTFQEATVSESQFFWNNMTASDILLKFSERPQRGWRKKGYIMESGYDDRDGKIWLDGRLIDWREANVHVLTHAMHYASSVFEGERAYNGKIFKSREHSERLIASAKLIDFDIPYSVDEIEL